MPEQLPKGWDLLLSSVEYLNETALFSMARIGLSGYSVAMNGFGTKSFLLSIASAIFGGLALAVLLLAALCELLAWMPVPGLYYLVCIGCILLSAAAAWSPPKAKQQLTASLTVIALLLVAVLHFVPWTSRKSFLRDLYSIEDGMSMEEVGTIMEGYITGTGWPEMPDITGQTPILISAASGASYETDKSESGELRLADSIVYRHSDDGTLNSDWGIVKFEDGKVSSVSFLPD